MAIRYFINENRIFTCDDYDHNLREVIRRENHNGTQLASTISDFCTAVSKCSIITDHETRISLLDTNFATFTNDLYASGGHLDTRINEIINNYAGVTAEYVIDSHSRTDLTKKANVSDVLWDDITNNSVNRTTIATLGWVKREVSLIEPDGVAWLDPSSRNYSKNTFSGIHDFSGIDTIAGTSLLYKTANLEMPSNEVATTTFVNQSFAKFSGLPVVTIGTGSNWNKITWTSGVVNGGTHFPSTINLNAYSNVNARINPPYEIGPSVGTYYLYYDHFDDTLLHTTDAVNIENGLVAKITLNSNQTSYVWQPFINLNKFAKLDSVNIFTSNNLFENGPTFGELDNANSACKGVYPIPDDDDSETLVTSHWTRNRLTEIRDSHWSIVNSPNTTAHQLRAKEGVIVDLRRGTGRIVDAWATTPTEESPLQAIATKQYVLEMFEATMGIPIVTLVNLDPPQIEWTSGSIDLPLSLATQLDKEECIVPASVSPMTISTSAKYIYVDYTTCAVVYSCDTVDETKQGKVIAVVSELDNGDITITPTPDGGWAPITSPMFKGDPRVPTPEADDCDTSIPNTQWVCDKIFNLIHGPCGNAFPRVYQINTVDGLQLAVGVTSGGISHPSRQNITIAPTVDPIGCVASTEEVCWIRYKDDPPYYDIVISVSEPSSEEGVIIATLTKNGNVINITHADSVATETTLSANYRAAWGGKIVYIGPVEC
jgi:hypothetical protein